MVRENAFLPKKSRQETCAGKGSSVLQSGQFFLRHPVVLSYIRTVCIILCARYYVYVVENK